VGPTGLGLANGGTLYVADSVNNRIAAVPHAMTRVTAATDGGRTVTSGGLLNDPLGLLIAPDGAIVTVNGANGNAIQLTPSGHVAAIRTLVPDGGGDLFGLALDPSGQGVYFVNDAGSGPGANSLEYLH
jgi:DNA-binding beta-propeller fold protein YncE